MPIKYLDNSPLYSAIIEIRFTAKIPEDAVPGVLFSKLSVPNQESIQITPLPASQLPLPIRQQDPNLKYAPTQRLSVAGQTINVGPNVLSLEANNARKEKTYPGWEEFSRQFTSIMEKMDFIDQIDRIGVRYVNVFNEDDFLSKLKVSLNTGWETRGLLPNSTIAFFVEHNTFKSKVTIASDAVIQDENGQRQAQIIDIDTFIDGEVPTEDLDLQINEAHKLTKEIFYSLPGDALMAKMGPHES